MVAHEEEATIVVDVGSSSVKAGLSGEDTPRAVFPSLAEDLDLSAEELSTYRARRPEVYILTRLSRRHVRAELFCDKSRICRNSAGLFVMRPCLLPSWCLYLCVNEKYVCVPCLVS